VRSIFAQPTSKEVWAQYERVGDELQHRFPTAAEMLQEAAEDILAFTTFPPVCLAPDLVEQSARETQSGDTTPQ